MQRALCRIERWLLHQADSVVSSSGLARGCARGPRGAAAGVASTRGRCRPHCPRRRPRCAGTSASPRGGRWCSIPARSSRTRGCRRCLRRSPRCGRRCPEPSSCWWAPRTPAAPRCERGHRPRAGRRPAGGQASAARADPAFLAMADVLVSPRALRRQPAAQIFRLSGRGQADRGDRHPGAPVGADGGGRAAHRAEAPDLARGIVRLLRDPELAAGAGRRRARLCRGASSAGSRSSARWARSMGGGPSGVHVRRSCPAPAGLGGDPGPQRGRAVSAGRSPRCSADSPPGVELEVMVVDDGSTDETAAVACGAGRPGPRARGRETRGAPGRGAQPGAAAATGDRWCSSTPTARRRRAGWPPCSPPTTRARQVVGGALDSPPGLPASGRCDHYCGSYHVHPARPAGYVPNHPPANLSVRREAFLATGGLRRQDPGGGRARGAAVAGQARRPGARIRFEPGRWSITTTGSGSAISCAGTSAGGTAPSRARRRPGPAAGPGSTATPAC